ILAAVAVTGFWGIQSVSSTTQSIMQNEAKFAQYSALTGGGIRNLRRWEKDYFLNAGAPDKQAEYLQRWSEGHERVVGFLTIQDKIAIVQEDKDLIASMRSQLAEYETGFLGVVGRMRDGRLKTPQDGNVAMGSLKDVIHKMEQNADEFAEKNNKRM